MSTRPEAVAVAPDDLQGRSVREEQNYDAIPGEVKGTSQVHLRAGVVTD